MLKRLSALFLSAAVMAACSESSTLPSESVSAPSTGRELIAELSCSADAAAARMTCAPVSATIKGGALGDLIIGGQNLYVKLTTTNIVNNGTTLSGDVTVQNLTVQPWATSDGTTPSAEGVRVFFYVPPTNGVTVANADGTGTFTSAGQLYHAYTGDTLGVDLVNGILAAGETSTPKNWVFNLNGQSSFTYRLYVSAKLPDEQGVLKWTSSPVNQWSIENLNTVWAFSPTDVWVGGSDPNALQHWNGTSWTATTDTLPVLDLWGSSATNLYAVGGKKIQRWNGTSWTELTSNASNPLLTIWGTSATDIWAGGFSGTLVHSTDGTTFSPEPSSGAGTEHIAAIWGTSSTDVWVGATNVYHLSGTTWSSVNTGITNIRSIWGSSATDIWMGATSGNMAHYASGSWSTTTVGSSDVTGIWGTASNDVYMVNLAGEIWHYNGSSWVKYTVSDAGFTSVWGSGRTDVWAAGGNAAFEENRVYHGTR